MSDGGKGGKGVPAWNKGGTIPEHQKEINRQMMKKRYENGLDVNGSNNPRAKTWRIVYNDGRELIIKSIHDWMNKNGYSKSAIRNVYTGKWLKTKDIICIEIVENTPSKSVQEILNDHNKKHQHNIYGKTFGY